MSIFKVSKAVWLCLVALTASSSLQSVKASSTSEAADDKQCEMLKTSLSYTQENAPQDISGVLPVIVERVNRELSGVVDVEVLFTGSEIHRRVGKHSVQCSVTRLLSALTTDSSASYKHSVDEHGRQVVTQCFLVPFTIEDVDECNVPLSHPMRHQCTSPAMCINTQGSYECICPDYTLGENFWERIHAIENSMSPWELSLNSSLISSCPGRKSTHNCCDSDAQSDGNCRSNFQCPLDPCVTKHTCDSSAKCFRSSDPLDQPSYTCECPSHLMGSGHKCRKGIDVMPPVPKLNFDGVTMTDETKKNGGYCGCTKPVVDVCSGFPKCKGNNEICTVTENNEPTCACKPGYVHVNNFGCVDEKPPILKLRHDSRKDGITRLKQGDSYKEYAVDVIDDNAEDYLRSLKIAYSRPLPPGCLADMGEFTVNYSVAMPWANPPYARVSRKVLIEDINECTLDMNRYETQCPQLIPQCDVEAGAMCQNTKGSYTCKCPKFTTGDGFKFMGMVQVENGKYLNAPVGYSGGTGCKDTSKPVIKLLGPNPKVFRTCKCGGLTGVMKQTKRKVEKDQKLIGDQREGYESDIVKMIKDTAAAELCASHTKQNPHSVECVSAIDHTFRGDVDLSSKVVVGTPEQVSDLEWKVPYNVMDDAGNAANTVWRRIVVEEVDLNEVEEKIRAEVLADRERHVKEAVDAALKEEQKKKGAVASSGRAQPQATKCPECPKCTCPKDGKGSGMSLAECSKHLGNMMPKSAGTCEAPQQEISPHYASGRTFLHNILDYMIDFTDGFMSPTLAGILFLVFFIVAILFIVQTMRSLNDSGWQYFDANDDQREREMLNSVTYYNSQGRDEIRSPTFVSPNRSVSQGNPASASINRMPAGSLSANRDAIPAPRSSIFSPPSAGRESAMNGSQSAAHFTSPSEGGIYNNNMMSPITPAGYNSRRRS